MLAFLGAFLPQFTGHIVHVAVAGAVVVNHCLDLVNSIHRNLYIITHKHVTPHVIM